MKIGVRVVPGYHLRCVIAPDVEEIDCASKVVLVGTSFNLVREYYTAQTNGKNKFLVAPFL